jgi:hypothetical protein
MSLSVLLPNTIRLALPLYLSTVLLGLVPIATTMLGLAPLAADRPWSAELLSPGWMHTAVEIFMGVPYARERVPLIVLMLLGVLLVPLAYLGQVVAYSFLAGGVLEAARPDANAAGAFWAACRRWFWPSFRLSLLGGILIVLAGAIGSALTGLARGAAGPELAAIIVLALQAVVLGWLELARAMMVTRADRSVGRAMVHSARAMQRPTVVPIWLALSLPGAGLLLGSLFAPPVSDPYSWHELVTARACGQALVFLGAWWKVVRLAVAMRLAAGTRQARPMRTTELSPARG